MYVGNPRKEGPPYAQERPAHNTMQVAGLGGRGWRFGRPFYFWKHATQTRGGAARLPLLTSSLQNGLGLGLALGLRQGSGWSGPTCTVEVDLTRPVRCCVQDTPAHRASRKISILYMLEHQQSFFCHNRPRDTFQNTSTQQHSRTGVKPLDT